MPDVETKLRIAAVDTSAIAFKQVAQAVEQMTQRVTKSQRVLVEAHKTSVQQMTEVASAGYTTLNRLAGLGGVALGAGALVAGVKESVKVFATVDLQARALSISTGQSLAKVKEFYERMDKVADAAKVPVDELRTAFDLLARRFTLEGAEAMIKGVAQAAAGMHTNAEEVANFNTQLIKTLGLTQKDIPAAFDSLVGAARGGGVKAAELAAGISTVARDMADIGMKGPKALYEVEAAMEAVGEVTKDSATAIEGVQGVIDAVNTKKMDKAFLQAGINIKHELEKGAKAGLSAIDVMVEQAHTAAVILQRLHPGMALEQAYAQLTKSPAVRQTLLELYAHKDVAAAARERIEASGGAMTEAAAKMTEGVSGKIQSFSNTVEEAKVALGSFMDQILRGIEVLGGNRPTGAKAPEKMPAGREFLPPTMRGWSWDWLKGLNPISSAGAAEAPHGGYPAIQGARPLIPSEPGSATERTAREQLEAIRRLERANVWRGVGGAETGAMPGGGGGRTPWTGGGGRTPGKGGSHVSPESGRGGGGTPNQYFTKENADAVRSAAKELGTTPEDLATVIGYETGGSFSPKQWGGAGGRYMGLIQFGPSERKQYGANENQSFKEQVTGPVVRYLKDRGFKPGMGLEDLYSTILAGAPGRSARRDSGGSGYEHVARMKGAMATRARRFLGSGGKGAPVVPGEIEAGQKVVPGQSDPHKPGFDPGAVKFHDYHREHSRLEDFRRKATEPVHVKVAYDFDAADVRTHSRAYARRSFDKQTRDSRYLSYTDLGTPA